MSSRLAQIRSLNWRRLITDPTEVFRNKSLNVNRACHRAVHPDPGTDFIEREWDTLIVLDGCRADLFEEIVNLDWYDSYERVRSPGSWTGEWAQNTFGNEEYEDIVYTTANPNVSKRAGEQFHDLIEVYDEHFDEETGTVMPNDVTDAAVSAHARYSNKRHIVHYVQPHHPFIETPQLNPNQHWNVQVAAGISDENHHEDVWDLLEQEEVSREAVWRGYGKNLDTAMPAVRRTCDTVDGRVVITSDHGNLLGERTWPIPIRLYGHPSFIRHSNLTTVPWAVVDRERRLITEDGVNSAMETDSDVVENRLQNLGYT